MYNYLPNAFDDRIPRVTIYSTWNKQACPPSDFILFTNTHSFTIILIVLVTKPAPKMRGSHLEINTTDYKMFSTSSNQRRVSTQSQQCNFTTSVPEPSNSSLMWPLRKLKRVSCTIIIPPGRRWSKVILWEQVQPMHFGLSGWRGDELREIKGRRDKMCLAHVCPLENVRLGLSFLFFFIELRVIE